MSKPNDDTEQSAACSGSVAEAQSISERTRAAIEREDSKLNKRAGWPSSDTSRNVAALLEFGRIEVGWRNSCGCTDFTMHVHESWVKIVKLLRKDGFPISEEVVKHGNSWATKGGGFWSSIIYTLG